MGPRRVCFTLVNRERKKQGHAPLTWSPVLGKSSQAAATEAYRDRGPLKHNARWWAKIYKYAGKKRFGEIGECLAEGQTTASTVVEDWHNSPGHFAVMNDKDVTHGAIGKKGNSWCLHTGEKS